MILEDLLIGLTIEQANSFVSQMDSELQWGRHSVRATQIDGRHQALLENIDSNRINVLVENSKITFVSGRG